MELTSEILVCLSPIEREVAEYLHAARKSGCPWVTAPQLERALNITSSPDNNLVREIIRNLNLKRVGICSGPRGFCWPSGKPDIKRYIESLCGRRDRIEERIAALVDSLGDEGDASEDSLDPENN